MGRGSQHPAASYTAQDLIFDPATHTSRLPDGRDVPHVTAVLAAVGISMDFEALAQRGQQLASSIELARARGTAVHADCHAYDDDDLDLWAVHMSVRPYLGAWIQFRSDKRLVPVDRERLLYHPQLVVAGIMDGVFAREDDPDHLVLVDIKTGDPEDSGCHLQTAAYAMMWALIHPDRPIAERWAVWLRPDLVGVPYRIINYTARPDHWLDQSRFEACLTVYREQPDRRARIR